MNGSTYSDEDTASPRMKTLGKKPIGTSESAAPGGSPRVSKEDRETMATDSAGKAKNPNLKRDRSNSPPVSDTDSTNLSKKKQRYSGVQKRPESTAESDKSEESALTLPRSADEQLSADFHGEGPSVLPGSRVLARWPDKNFYPGQVLHRDGLGRYTVQYLEDGVIRTMPPPDILPLTQISKGNKLMIRAVRSDGDEELQPVTIAECPSNSNANEWFAGKFLVNNSKTEKTEKVLWERFVIDKDQTKQFVDKLLSKTADEVKTENIEPLAGERPRRSRLSAAAIIASVTPEPKKPSTPQPTKASQFTKLKAIPASAPVETLLMEKISSETKQKETPKTSVTKQEPQKAKKLSLQATPVESKKKSAVAAATASGTMKKAPTTPTATTSKKIPVVEMKKTPVAVAPQKKATATPTESTAKGRGRVRSDAAEVEEAQMEEVGIAPIFDGMQFVLTSANRRIARPGTDKPSGFPFFKKQVRTFIEQRGGTVIEDFNGQPAKIKDCFLIADTHYRTHKYLSALTRAVPCVSHQWIYESCSRNTLLPYKDYLLPAGLSILKQDVVSWHDLCPNMLKGKTVLISAQRFPSSPNNEQQTAPDFVQIWTPLVEILGAKVLTELPEEGRVDILLTDGSCSQTVLDGAEKLHANAVSSEWLIQAIICGQPPDPKSHEKFVYNFVEPVSSSAE